MLKIILTEKKKTHITSKQHTQTHCRKNEQKALTQMTSRRTEAIF